MMDRNKLFVALVRKIKRYADQGISVEDIFYDEKDYWICKRQLYTLLVCAHCSADRAYCGLCYQRQAVHPQSVDVFYRVGTSYCAAVFLPLRPYTSYMVECCAGGAVRCRSAVYRHI